MKSRWAVVLVIVLMVGLLGMGAVVAYGALTRQATPAPTGLPTALSGLAPALPTPTPPPEGAVIIPDTTKVLTGATIHNLASISDDGSTFSFSETTTQLDSLSRGDVIVSDVSDVAPDGFLRKVDSVSTEGGQVVVRTLPARLEDAIHTGSLSVTRQLKPGDVRAGWQRPGVALVSLAPMSAQPGWNVTLDDVVLFDLDGNTGTSDDQVRANGHIAFEPSLDFDCQIAWFQLRKLTLMARATESVDLKLSGDVQLLGVHEEVDVALFPLNPIPLSIGPVPIVLTPILNVSVGLDGTAHVGFVTGVTQQASVAAGVQYLDGKWNPIHTFDNSFEFIPPTLTGGLQVEAYGSIQLAVLIYGVGGPYASLNGYFGLDANVQRAPAWRLYGGLRCVVGVQAEILGYELGNYRETVLNSRTAIGEGGAPATTPPTLTPTTIAPVTPSSTPTRTSTPSATPSPTATPTPTSRPPCALAVQGEFAALWRTYQQDLGCPLTESPLLVPDAEQAFDLGRMLWRADTLTIYVLYEQGTAAGTYQAYADTWREGDAPYSCSATAPDDRVQPWRGFGKLWCSLGASDAAIGWGLAPEQGFEAGSGDPLVHDFERGALFRDSSGTAQREVYILFTDDNRWVRVGY